MLTVLSVACPFAPVSRGTGDGAEEVLSLVDEGLLAAGHRSLVICAECSNSQGELVPTLTVGAYDPGAHAAAQQRHREMILRALERGVDVVHYHGIDFGSYVARTTVPQVVTLHLPPGWYPADIYKRDDLFLVCVSEVERAAAPRCDAVVPNGVDLSAFHPNEGDPDDYVLTIGRICVEKNFHAAMDAARRAHTPLILAGHVANYPAHVRYFEQEIVPRCDQARIYIGPIAMPGKRDLIADARAVIASSTVAEPGSMVAMEALACGTPVIAMRSAALQDIVEHGVTGFIVDSGSEMAGAIRRIDSIDRRACRRAAEERFDARMMVSKYLALYNELTAAKRP